MVEETMEVETDATTGAMEARLSGVGWGLFILWIGVAFLAGVEAWITLLGIGVITLGTQAARKALGLDFEGFWLVVGVLFVLGGLWDLSGTTVPLLPVLLIVAGLAVAGSAVMNRSG